METYLTKDPLKTTRLIGQMCKCGNAFSLLVLIGREAWPQNNLHNCLNILCAYIQIFAVFKVKVFSVAIAKRKHPFPSRTRKLSSFAPMVLLGRLSGRVGRCRKIFIYPGITHYKVYVIPGFFLRKIAWFRQAFPCAFLK